MLVQILLLALCATHLALFGQDGTKSANSKLKPVPPAPCTALGNPRSCSSFNEMLAGHDPDFANFEKPGKIHYVCFSKMSESFLTISFYNSAKHLYGFDPSEISGFGKSDDFAITKYVKGQQDIMYSTMIHWNWVKDIFGSWAAKANHDKANKYDIQDLIISEARIYLVLNYMDQGGDATNETIEIRRSTNRFQATFENARFSSFSEAGKCIVYPR